MSRLPVKYIFLIGVSLIFSSPSNAQQVMAYKQGVTNDQSMKDQTECANWATQQTGYNPAYASSVQTGPDGSRVRGAAGGAAVGAVVGGISGGSAGKGAAAGAAAVVSIGGMRKRQKQRQQQDYQNQMQATYTRALTTCLQGRGYAVN